MKKLKIECAVLGMISTNCYFLNNTQTEETVIVDPADSARSIYDWCLNNRRKPAAILLTHGHFDHMKGAEELRDLFNGRNTSGDTDGRIKIYAAEKEREVLENAEYNLSGKWTSPITLKADEFLKDGQKLSLAGFEIEVIATPGHTAGGLCYYIPEEQVLVSGDTLFAGSYGRVDFPTSSMSDLARSIRERLLVLPEDTVVYPGHGESTTIQYERAHNPLTQWMR